MASLAKNRAVTIPVRFIFEQDAGRESFGVAFALHLEASFERDPNGSEVPVLSVEQKRGERLLIVYLVVTSQSDRFAKKFRG